MTGDSPAKNGFSLLELVAVLAIFALVALIGVQVMQSTLRNSERLTEVNQQSGELAVALSLLRQDLDNAMPRAFIAPSKGAMPALAITAEGFALTVGGLARLASGTSGFGRVNWRYDPETGQLLRRVWTSLTPGAPGAASPEITVLTNVTAFTLSSFTKEGGWRRGFNADPRDPSALPLGLRVGIDHTRVPNLNVTVSLR